MQSAPEACTITIHMVCSLDGYIARKDNSMQWFETEDHYANGLPEQDAATFLQTIGCYVMGARTYELALRLSAEYGWPYGDTQVIVVTHRPLPINRQHIEFYTGDLPQLVQQRLQGQYRHVWVVGGAMLAGEFIRLGLANEIRQSILPILLGGGLSFYEAVDREQALHLKNAVAYKTGLVELCYEIRKSNDLL